MDDEREGKEYGRVYVNSLQLNQKRNVYIDPESLHVTDYEYGYSYCVKGGVPLEAIARVEVIRAKKLPPSVVNSDTSDWSDDATQAEQRMAQQTARLHAYLTEKLTGEN